MGYNGIPWLFHTGIIMCAGRVIYTSYVGMMYTITHTTNFLDEKREISLVWPALHGNQSYKDA